MISVKTRMLNVFMDWYIQVLALVMSHRPNSNYRPGGQRPKGPDHAGGSLRGQGRRSLMRQAGDGVAGSGRQNRASSRTRRRRVTQSIRSRTSSWPAAPLHCSRRAVVCTLAGEGAQHVSDDAVEASDLAGGRIMVQLVPDDERLTQCRVQTRPAGAGEARVAVRDEHVWQPHVAEH